MVLESGGGQLHEEISPALNVTVWLASRIGDPIDRPATIAIEARFEPGVQFQDVAGAITRVVEERLARMPKFCQELSEGIYDVC